MNVDDDRYGHGPRDLSGKVFSYNTLSAVLKFTKLKRYTCMLLLPLQNMFSRELLHIPAATN